MQVFKYPFGNNGNGPLDKATFNAPEGMVFGNVVHFDFVPNEGDFTVWIEVREIDQFTKDALTIPEDLRASDPVVDNIRTLQVFGTGYNVPDYAKHIQSIVTPVYGSRFVWHLYDLTNPLYN